MVRQRSGLMGFMRIIIRLKRGILGRTSESLVRPVGCLFYLGSHPKHRFFPLVKLDQRVENGHGQGQAMWGGYGYSAGFQLGFDEGIQLVLLRSEMDFTITAVNQSAHPPYTDHSHRAALTSRESEAAYLEKLNEGIAKGTSWERVTDMIQLENSRKSPRGARPFTSPSLNILVSDIPLEKIPSRLLL